MDIMCNWIRCFPAHDANDKTQRLHQLWQDRAGAYDLVVVLPIGTFPFEDRNDLGMRRRTNLTVQVMAASITAGLATLVEPAGKVLHLKADSSVAERVSQVIARLAVA